MIFLGVEAIDWTNVCECDGCDMGPEEAAHKAELDSQNICLVGFTEPLRHKTRLALVPLGTVNLCPLQIHYPPPYLH